ncbi:MAG TPA: hypothetical protein VGX68_12945 [Thermoanaerobaculia bacterium]|jgi:hypothetical protein|nr:hypothetical protein [Thermoanaerobaculia bacterium]
MEADRGAYSRLPQQEDPRRHLSRWEREDLDLHSWGKAVWPDHTFRYEVSIDESEADCDYIFHPQKGEVGETKRYGFRWMNDRLRIYAITYPKDGAAPIHCDKLLAELAPK